MRQLAEQANLPIADIDQIQRQKGQYREAVEAVSQGRTAEGFEVLDKLGWVEEIENEKERGKTLADAYVKRISEGRTALVVSPTHKEKDRVTKEIRAGLKEKGLLKEEEATTIRQINLNWTEAQRKDIRNYEAGQAIQFTQNCPGIKRGERMRIIEGQTPESLMAQRQNGEQIEIPLDQAGRFQVYRQKEMALMQGDRIAITQNGFCQDDKGKKKRLINGMVYEVKACKEEGKVHLKNGWIIDQSFGHIDHGYCTTSYKAQGKTVDHVFLAQSVESNPAASREQFYVSVSRAKRSVTIYTDDKKELKQAVYGSQERQTVKELEAEDQHYQKKKLTQERKEMFAENASSFTKAIEREKGPEPPQPKEKSLETTEKPLRAENELVLEQFTAQIEEITEPEAEGLTRDAGKKPLTPVREDGGKESSTSLEERRKRKRISIQSLVGVMGQYMDLSEAERAELRQDLKEKLAKDQQKELRPRSRAELLKMQEQVQDNTKAALETAKSDEERKEIEEKSRRQQARLTILYNTEKVKQMKKNRGQSLGKERDNGREIEY